MTEKMTKSASFCQFLPVLKSNWQPQTLENTGFFAKSASLPVFFLLSHRKIKNIKRIEKFFGILAEIHF